MWHRIGTITLKKGTNKVLGINTKWLDKLSNVEAGQPLIVNNNIYEITQVKSDTELYIKELALEDAINSSYVIMSVVYGSLGDVALKASKALAHYQEQMQVFDQMYSGTEPFTVIKPDGTEIEMMPYSLLNISVNELNENIRTVASYATNAENSANQAQSSASDASQYALNASNLAKQSKDSATLSAESASKSLQFANDSASSANNASQSASQAKQSEETALTHANDSASRANDSAQSANESKSSAEEAKQAALSALNGFNKDLLIQEFEQLSEEEKQAIKDHLGVINVNTDRFVKVENNLSDISDKAKARENLGIAETVEVNLTGLLLAENNLSDVKDKTKALQNLDAMNKSSIKHDMISKLVNVDTLIELGFYNIAGGSENWAGGTSGGTLLVIPHSSKVYITQLAFVGGRTLVRYLPGSGVWNIWTELANLNYGGNEVLTTGNAGALNGIGSDQILISPTNRNTAEGTTVTGPSIATTLAGTWRVLTAKQFTLGTVTGFVYQYRRIS